MGIKEAISVINRMQADGVVERYAIGGAVGATFYLEPVSAVALHVGRARDKARLLQFIEAGALDAKSFQSILARHDLVDAWRKFERQFLGDTP